MSNQRQDIFLKYQVILHCQGRGWWEGTGAAAKIASFAGASFAGEPGARHRGIEKNNELLYSKGAGAACAQRDQH